MRANFETGFKACSRCKIEQPLESFCKARSAWDGLAPQCKKCQKEYYNRNAETKRASSKEYNRIHSKEKKEYEQKRCKLPKRRLVNYKGGAKRKGRAFTLTDEQAFSLFQQPCFYCGGPGYGIDRVDNLKGYELDNCVPCCSFCNEIKSNLPISLFVAWIEKVASRVPIIKERQAPAV